MKVYGDLQIGSTTHYVPLGPHKGEGDAITVTRINSFRWGCYAAGTVPGEVIIDVSPFEVPGGPGIPSRWAVPRKHYGIAAGTVLPYFAQIVTLVGAAAPFAVYACPPFNRLPMLTVAPMLKVLEASVGAVDAIFYWELDFDVIEVDATTWEQVAEESA